MKTLTSISVLATIFCTTVARAQSTDVTIRLKVIRIDATGEHPVNHAWVCAFPKNKGVFPDYTNANGEIAFAFPATESVIFRVGTRTQNVALAPLSGRLSQSMSYLDDRREEGRTYQTCTSVVSKAIFTGTEAYCFLEIMEDIKTQAGGRLMTVQTREFLKSLTPLINEVTSAPADATPEHRAAAESARAELMAEQHSLLAPPWRMGATVTDNSDGVIVNQVEPNGPAASVGIGPGDLIVQVNQQNVSTAKQSFKWMIANSEQPTVKLKVKKPNGQIAEPDVTLVR